jgi:DNA polymerase-4
MSNERIAGIIIPDFLLELCYRQQPSLRLQPVALTEGTKPSAPVLAMNQPAIENRVALKMTALQARALCPDLSVVINDNDHAVEQSRKLQTLLQTIGPLVEQESPGVYFMDISGLRRLHGNETKITQSIITLIAKQNYQVKVGVAESKFIARVAAETSQTDNFTIVKRGDDVTFIEKLDIDRLPLSDDTRNKLRQLGLKKIGQLSFFPANEMSTRFGAEGTRLSQLSHGRDTDRLLREWPENALSNEMSLTYRIYNAAVIVRHAEKLLRPLFEKLSQSGLGCHRLEITLTIEDRSHESIVLSVSKPTLSISKITRQLQQHLEKTKLSAGVMGLKVDVPQHGVAVLPSQQGTLDNTPSSPTKRNNAEQDKILKDHRMCQVSFNAALLPEQSFELAPVADEGKRSRSHPKGWGTSRGKASSLSGTSRSHIRKQPSKCDWTASTNRPSGENTLYVCEGLRLLPTPLAADIITEHGHPSLVTAGHAHQPIDHHVGPWQLSGGWWDSDFDRLYYQMQMPGQRRYLCFYDRLRSQWYLHGIFD